MKAKPLHKLNQVDKDKITARYEKKLEEFKDLTLEELKELWNTKKMSATDKHALVEITQRKWQQKVAEEAELKGKELIITDNIEGE